MLYNVMLANKTGMGGVFAK